MYSFKCKIIKSEISSKGAFWKVGCILCRIKSYKQMIQTEFESISYCAWNQLRKRVSKKHSLHVEKCSLGFTKLLIITQSMRFENLCLRVCTIKVSVWIYINLICSCVFNYQLMYIVFIIMNVVSNTKRTLRQSKCHSVLYINAFGECCKMKTTPT